MGACNVPPFLCYNVNMAIPADFNIKYYVGDTHEFTVAVKQSGNIQYDLTGFEASFVISDVRSVNPDWSVDGTVTVDATRGTLTCLITPDVGNQLATGKKYYYDVEVRKTIDGVLRVYTLLKGQITPEIGVSRSV